MSFIETRASCLPGKCPTTEPHLWPYLRALHYGSVMNKSSLYCVLILQYFLNGILSLWIFLNNDTLSFIYDINFGLILVKIV